MPTDFIRLRHAVRRRPNGLGNDRECIASSASPTLVSRIRRMGRFVVLVLIAAAVSTGCDSTPVASPKAPIEPRASNGVASQDAAVHVLLLIDFGDRKPLLEKSLELTGAPTVLDALQTGCGGDLEVTGSGETAFVRGILGVANEGAGGDNWTYRVNGELGNRSAGIMPLSDNDRVEWTLGDYVPDTDVPKRP